MSGFIVSWSGGKDCMLSLHRALHQSVKVSYLMSFVSNNGRSMSHALNVKLLKAQSEALEIPIVMKEVTWETYEQGFKEQVNALKREGIEGCIFGDVEEITEHREWNERICKELGIEGLSPLFGDNPEKVFREFIGLGFEAIVIMVNMEFLGDEWVGRKLDQGFLNDLLKIKGTKNVDVLGELGEYHTFVYDGPIFKKRIELLKTQKVPRNGYTYVDITNFKLTNK